MVLNNLRRQTPDRTQTLPWCLQLAATGTSHIGENLSVLRSERGSSERRIRERRGRTEHTAALQGARFHYHNTVWPFFPYQNILNVTRPNMGPHPWVDTRPISQSKHYQE